MDEDLERQGPRTWRSGWRRIAGAGAVALVLGLGVYALLEAVRPDGGLISFSFLLVLPAAICAFIAYVADPWAQQPLRAYLLVPVWVLFAVFVVSGAVLREGVICIVMLTPLWLVSGIVGAALAYKARRRSADSRTFCAGMLAAPLAAMLLEPLFPLPQATATVTRSVVIAASPATIWPLLRGIPDVQPGEGAWNLSQDVIGIPRPLGARLVGNGIGADRFADWGRHIRFRERVTEWQAGRRIGWRFLFDDVAGWQFTDRHLMPDSRYFTVTTGGYTLHPLDAGHTRVTIDTTYRMQTPLNGYAALWGELFLGDLETNLLALVRGRAEVRGSLQAR